MTDASHYFGSDFLVLVRYKASGCLMRNKHPKICFYSKVCRLSRLVKTARGKFKSRHQPRPRLPLVRTNSHRVALVRSVTKAS